MRNVARGAVGLQLRAPQVREQRQVPAQVLLHVVLHHDPPQERLWVPDGGVHPLRRRGRRLQGTSVFLAFGRGRRVFGRLVGTPNGVGDEQTKSLACDTDARSPDAIPKSFFQRTKLRSLPHGIARDLVSGRAPSHERATYAVMTLELGHFTSFRKEPRRVTSSVRGRLSAPRACPLSFRRFPWRWLAYSVMCDPSSQNAAGQLGPGLHAVRDQRSAVELCAPLGPRSGDVCRCSGSGCG